MTCVCVFVCLAGPPPADIGDALSVSGLSVLEQAYGNEQDAASEALNETNELVVAETC